ncbi:MAG: restriction endonuclease [Ignisphaera sp.]
MTSYITVGDVLEHLFRYKALEPEFVKLLKPIDRNLVEEIFVDGLKRGCIAISDSRISLVNPLELLLLIEEKMVVDVMRFASYIEWKEFEDYIAARLKSAGLDYVSGYTHKRISQFQIDVLALDMVKKMGYIIECKHWRRRIGQSSVSKIVREHMTRIDKLVKYCEWVASEVPAIRKTKLFIPIVITLYTSSTWVFEGVPIVSVRFLNDFLSNIDVYIDSLELKRIDNRCYIK